MSGSASCAGGDFTRMGGLPPAHVAGIVLQTVGVPPPGIYFVRCGAAGRVAAWKLTVIR